MSERKPFAVVHQGDAFESDSLEGALNELVEIRLHYHQGGYRNYDFEGGIYKKIDENSDTPVKLPNQAELDQRTEERMKPFAVITRYDDKSLLGTTVTIDDAGPFEIGKDIGLPELKYNGFDTLESARIALAKNRDKEAGLYQLIFFDKHTGPARVK